jgi:hypothetical protein
LSQLPVSLAGKTILFKVTAVQSEYWEFMPAFSTVYLPELFLMASR